MIYSIWFNALCIYQNLCWFLLKHKVKNPINTLFLVEIYIMHIDWLPIKKIILPGIQKSLYNDNIAVRSFWICLHHPKIKNNCLLEYVTLENQKMGNLRLILHLVESLRLIFYIRPFNQKKTRKQLKICVHLARILILPGQNMEWSKAENKVALKASNPVNWIPLFKTFLFYRKVVPFPIFNRPFLSCVFKRKCNLKF